MAEEKKEKKKKRNEKEMPFLDHLEELRWRLIKCIVAVVASSIILYVFLSDQIMWILTRPGPEKFIFLAPTEGFMIYIKISIFGGIIVSLPIIFYQIYLSLSLSGVNEISEIASSSTSSINSLSSSLTTISSSSIAYSALVLAILASASACA